MTVPNGYHKSREVDRFQALLDTAHSDSAWTVQQAGNLLMDLGARAARSRFLVRDRGGQFTGAFGAVLADRRDRGGEDPAAESFGEPLCRTLGAHRPVQDHRPDAHRRAAACAGVLDEHVVHCNGHRPHRAAILTAPAPCGPPRHGAVTPARFGHTRSPSPLRADLGTRA
jgi:putative transposase